MGSCRSASHADPIRSDPNSIPLRILESNLAFDYWSFFVWVWVEAIANSVRFGPSHGFYSSIKFSLSQGFAFATSPFDTCGCPGCFAGLLAWQ